MGEDVDISVSLESRIDNSSPVMDLPQQDSGQLLNDLQRKDARQFRQGVAFSAPANANDAFDYEAYQRSRYTGQPLSRVALADPRIDTFDDLTDPGGNGMVSRVDAVNRRLAPTQVGLPDAAASEVAVNEMAVAESPVVLGFGSRMMHNLREDRQGMAFSAGYSAMALGSGASALVRMDDGQYHTPEQFQAAQANAFLPAVGGMIGAVAGTAIGGATGGLVGNFAGQAAGQFGAAAIGAADERAQATREAAEKLTAALGEATSSVSSFKTQIEATGAPVAQLGQALGAVGGMGTYGPGTVAGTGALVNAFQERAGEDFAAIGKYTSGPLMFGMGNRFSTGTAGRGDLTSLGYDAAETGDFGALKTFQQAVRDATAKNDTQYQDTARQLSKDESSPIFRFRAWFNHITGATDEPADYIAADHKSMDARKTALSVAADPVAEQQNLLINQFAGFRSARIVAESGVGVASSGIGLAEAHGGSAAQIGQASEALYGSLGAARAATQGEIGLLQQDIANPINAGRAQELQARIADASARLGGYDVAEARQRRSVYDTGLQEEGAGFSLAAGRATLSGRSAASLLGGYDRQAAFLSGQAEDPRNPLSPSERSGIEQSALQMRYTAGLNVFQEQERGVAISEASANAGLSRAEVLGTPMDAYRARLGIVGAEEASLGVIGGRLGQVIPNAERQGLLAERAALQGQVAIGAESARVGAYDAQGGILGDTQGANRAGFNRDLGVLGNAAFLTHRVFQDDAAAVALYAGAEGGSPVGSAQRARFGRLRADATEAQTEAQDSAYTFRQTQGQRVRDVEDEGAFHRAMLNPYMDGPESNPLTRGNAVLGDLRGRLRGEETALRNTPQSSPAYEANARMIEDTRNQIAQLQHEQLTGMFGALPEGIVGAAGSGVMAGIVPTAAMAARYTANPMFGSFGPGAVGPVSTMGAMTPGGQAGGFQNQGGVSEIVAALNRQTDTLARVFKGGGGGANSYAGGGYGTGFNPARQTSR